MAVEYITFDDKVATRESNLPRKNSITEGDINELKRVVNNNADEISGGGIAVWTVEIGASLSRTFLSPADVKITSVESNIDQEIQIEVGAYPYVFGNEISKWEQITITTEPRKLCKS